MDTTNTSIFKAFVNIYNEVEQIRHIPHIIIMGDYLYMVAMGRINNVRYVKITIKQFHSYNIKCIHNCQNNNGRYQCLCTTGYLTNDNGECVPGNS
jgi:hypothetical protein